MLMQQNLEYWQGIVIIDNELMIRKKFFELWSLAT